MKKFFAFVAAALVAFGFTACNGNDPSKPKVDGTFTITVSDITSNSANVTVEPSVAKAPYFWNVFATEAVQYYGGADSLLLLYMDYYKNQGYTYADLVEGLLIIEDGKDSYEYSELDPETEYTVIACYVDTALQLLSAPVAKEFKTTEFVVTGSEVLNLSDAMYNWAYYTDYSLGLLQIMAVDAAKDSLVFSTVLYTGETADGTYTAEDMYEPYADYGYYNYYNYLYNDELDVTFVSLALTGAMNADSTYTFGGTIVGDNGIEYTFANVVATQYVAEDEEGEAEAAPAKKVAAKKVAVKKAFRDLKVKRIALK